MKFQSISSLSLLWASRSNAFMAPARFSPSKSTLDSSTSAFLSSSNWDDEVDYDQEFNIDENGELPDPTSNWDDRKPEVPFNAFTLRNEINIGETIKFTEEQIAELKQEAADMMSDKIDEGIQDIERMREKMRIEFDKSRKLMKMQSEYNAQVQSEQLMNKIDRLTGKFMESTKESRKSTMLAATADASMEGKGVELGSWGSVGGAAVATLGNSLSRSVPKAEGEEETFTAPRENRIMIIADESQDDMAKQLIPEFRSLLEKSMDVTVEVIKPTATMPLGGNNAACLVFFATSLTSPPTAMLDRLLRRTLQAGSVPGSPPSQLVCVSTIGTERTNKMPYSMQNFVGGKLERRRQIEESIISTVKTRTLSPPLDYTICKFGEIKPGGGDLQFQPGDVLDGTTTAESAANILVQAVAFQRAARNATLCAVGSLPEEVTPDLWDQEFLKLDGPELWRIGNLGDPSGFFQLVEYIREWAELLAAGKGLTTPTRAERTNPPADPKYQGVKAREGAKLVFLPTSTGTAYRSKTEERLSDSGDGNSSPPTFRNSKLEGGVEVLVEVTTKDEMRIRARRCNMGDSTTIKELSEETILGRLKECIEVWKKSPRGKAE